MARLTSAYLHCVLYHATLPCPLIEVYKGSTIFLKQSKTSFMECLIAATPEGIHIGSLISGIDTVPRFRYEMYLGSVRKVIYVSVAPELCLDIGPPTRRHRTTARLPLNNHNFRCANIPQN